jgi:DNA repair protein RecN (Recombination protein N)
MLKLLEVKNFAIIDSLQLEFSNGLNILTGETGAGKSILIEALGFVLGARASSDFLREGSPKAQVKAVFDSSCLPKQTQKEFEITKPTFTILRELDLRARSKAFVNSKPVSLSTLSKLGDNLVDFHGQHDHQTLLSSSVHLELLDRFAGLESETESFFELFGQRQQVQAKLSAVKISQEEKERLLDLYKFQLNEIEQANLQPNEDEELEIKLPKMKNSGKLLELSEQAYDLLYSGENSALEFGGKAQKTLGELVNLDSDFSDVLENVNQAVSLLEDSAERISAYKNELDMDPAQLDELMSRQEKIKTLKKKYGPEISDVLQKRETLSEQIDNLEFSDKKEQELKDELQKLDKELAKKAEALHDKRFAHAKRLSDLVLKEIKPLGFAEIRFSVAVEMDENNMTSTGADTVEFLFSANPGQPLKSLKSIASGGEMSRVMLGLKTVLAGSDQIPVLVFDEVDSGVGAVVGRLVGQKLSKVSKKHQVLCVTHLPQVLGFADRHFSIAKRRDNDATVVVAKQTNLNERTEELAKMLAGKREYSKLSLNHAKELLAECSKVSE